MALKRSILLILITAACCVNVRAGIVTNKAALDGFFAGDASAGGILTYVKESDGCIYYIDLTEETLTERQVCSVSTAVSPLISPDGRMITFWSGGGEIYVCPVGENVAADKICNGFDPHWFIKGDSTFIVYCTVTGRMTWPMPGATMRQRIVYEEGAFRAEGALDDTLVGMSFTGGLSKNGKYLCTAYDDVVMYDLVLSTEYRINETIQACNASITPTTSTAMFKDAEMMMLSLGITLFGTPYGIHEVFYIRNIYDQVIWYLEHPPGTDEWQKPEWSTHDDYAVATGKKGVNYHVYIVKISEEDFLEVVDGNNSYPHLWVTDQVAIRDGFKGKTIRGSAIEVSPNPFTRTTAVTVTGYTDGTVLSVVTIDGSLVQTLGSPDEKGGLIWDSGSLEPGIYVLKVETDHGVIAKRLLLNK